MKVENCACSIRESEIDEENIILPQRAPKYFTEPLFLRRRKSAAHVRHSYVKAYEKSKGKALQQSAAESSIRRPPRRTAAFGGSPGYRASKNGTGLFLRYPESAPPEADSHRTFRVLAGCAPPVLHRS